MSTVALKSHIIIKSLKEAGFDDRQAETIVEAISDMQDSHLATKDDLSRTESAMTKELQQINQSIVKLDTSIGKLETSIGKLETNMGKLETSIGKLEINMGKLETNMGKLETNMEWIKKLLITIGIAVVIAAIKYIFAL